MDSDEYLAAFVNGVEFALLAFEGRLRGADLDAESERRIRAFARDYRRVIEEYRTRRGPGTAPPSSLDSMLLAARLN